MLVRGGQFGSHSPSGSNAAFRWSSIKSSIPGSAYVSWGGHVTLADTAGAEHTFHSTIPVVFAADMNAGRSPAVEDRLQAAGWHSHLPRKNVLEGIGKGSQPGSVAAQANLLRGLPLTSLHMFRGLVCY